MIKIDYQEIMEIHNNLGPLLDRWERDNPKKIEEEEKKDGNDDNNREN